jgi:predicted Zn-dependent protease
MTETVANLFDEAIKQYQAGESAAKLIPTFVDICNRSPKLDSAWTCLSWLYLLENKPQDALKAAQKANKINPYDAQTRINLALAMLDCKQSGVREHIELAGQMMLASDEVHNLVMDNIADGLQRKPNWASLERVKKWLTE